MKQIIITALLLISAAVYAQTPTLPLMYPREEKYAKIPQLETVKPKSYSRQQLENTRIIAQEKKLVKLAAKRWGIDEELKSNLEQLKLLETNDKSPKHKFYKRKVDQLQKELALAILKVEYSTQKLKELEATAEDNKYKIYEN